MKKTIVPILILTFVLGGCGSMQSDPGGGRELLREIGREAITWALQCALVEDDDTDFEECLADRGRAWLELRAADIAADLLARLDIGVGDELLDDIARGVVSWSVDCVLAGDLSRSCIRDRAKLWAKSNAPDLIEKIVELVDRLLGGRPPVVMAAVVIADPVKDLAILLPEWAETCEGVELCIVERADAWIALNRPGRADELRAAVRRIVR